MTDLEDLPGDQESPNLGHIRIMLSLLFFCVPTYVQVLKPGLVKGQWSQEEDDRLVGVVERGFRNWGQVRT